MRMSDPSLEHRILILQLFLATAVLSVSVVAIVFADLKRANTAVSRSEERYRELASSMEMLAAEDSLTGMANRRQFDLALAREWQRAARNHCPSPCSCSMSISSRNTTTSTGTCRAIAACRRDQPRLAFCAPQSDTVARFGGSSSPSSCLKRPLGVFELAESMRAAVLRQAIKHVRNPHQVVTVSIGCSTWRPSRNGRDRITRGRPTAALYRPKAMGAIAFGSQGGLRPVASLKPRRLNRRCRQAASIGSAPLLTSSE